MFKNGLHFVCNNREKHYYGLNCVLRTLIFSKNNIVCNTNYPVPDADELCYGNLTHASEIRTPNYPYFYGGGLNCLWTLQAPLGQFAALNITKIHLAPLVNAIQVYIYNNHKSYVYFIDIGMNN